jgi:hypothetical protein
MSCGKQREHGPAPSLTSNRNGFHSRRTDQHRECGAGLLSERGTPTSSPSRPSRCWPRWRPQKKTFPGGKGNISLGVKGDYGAAGVDDGVVGYTHNDTVSFYTPANIKRVNFPWREHHIGITLTHTELKIDGISVTDETGDGTSTSMHSDREMTVLAGLLDDKLEDFGEQYARTMNALMWDDGTGDAKALAGIQAIIVREPVHRHARRHCLAWNTWWRNRLPHGGVPGGDRRQSGARGLGWRPRFVLAHQRRGAAAGSAEGIPAADPLRRRPNKAFCGSDFLSALQVERRANGFYSQTGFDKSQSIVVGDAILPGGAVPEYDPTLDDLGLPSACIGGTRGIST